MHRAPAPLLDIAYYDGVDAHLHKHKLDVFHPPNLKASAALRPVVLHVHGTECMRAVGTNGPRGGGWVRGDRKQEFYGGPFMGRAFSERGYVTVVCSYRLSEHGKHPAQVRDVARALAWVMANIKSYGGDAGNVFLSGHSAGAHIIALLALHPKFLAEVGLTRSHIKGVVAISGIYHLLYPMHERSACVLPTAQQFVRAFNCLQRRTSRCRLPRLENEIVPPVRASCTTLAATNTTSVQCIRRP